MRFACVMKLFLFFIFSVKILSYRKGLLLPWREKRKRYFLKQKIKQKKRDIYLHLILVTNLTIRRDKER